MKPKSPIRGVLFDLDGTLLHTAPDLLFALNLLRAEYQLPPMSMEIIKPLIGIGSRVMISKALNLDISSIEINPARERFLDLYQNHLADSTHFFPEMASVLDFLEQQQIPWGIVTNKLTKPTEALLHALNLQERPNCIVCGDTLTVAKPDPTPILHACEQLQRKPSECIYLGDAKNDVTASKAAGAQAIVALYGYLDDSDPYSWSADGYINMPKELLKWF